MFAEHHQSHAASAFYPSPFERAAVMCLDGVGESATTTVWQGEGNRLEPLWEIDFPHSLGLLYSAFTYYTGFKVNSGEYKLMGLAPYGEPKYVELIRENTGTVDTVIYSLAAPARTDPVTGAVYNSVIKPIGEPFSSKTLDATTRKFVDFHLEPATEEEIATLFKDCEPGAVPPLGPAYGVETLLDEALASLDEVYFEAGDHEQLVHVNGEGFRNLLRGVRHGYFSHEH